VRDVTCGMRPEKRRDRKPLTASGLAFQQPPRAYFFLAVFLADFLLPPQDLPQPMTLTS